MGNLVPISTLLGTLWALLGPAVSQTLPASDGDALGHAPMALRAPTAGQASGSSAPADEAHGADGAREAHGELEAHGAAEADRPHGEHGAQSADGATVELAFPVIDEWQRPLRRCARRGRRRFCDGPRQIPAPHGEAAERAERLGLEGRGGWFAVMGGAAPEALLAEVPSDPNDRLLWPVPEGFMGRGFGHTRSGRLRHRLHRGVDIPAPVGSLVRAARGGLVVYADNSVTGYGNMVAILHADDTRTTYAHLKRSAVFAGQRVARGQVVGEVGRTGLTYAPHLHFEYRVRARARNPRRRFVERPTHEQERQMMNEAARRRREGQARLAELRAAREAREARRAAATSE